MRTLPGVMISKKGLVRYQEKKKLEVPARDGQSLGFDEALRTLRYSRAFVRLADQSSVNMREITRLVIIQSGEGGSPGIQLDRGSIYYSHRNRPELGCLRS